MSERAPDCPSCGLLTVKGQTACASLMLHCGARHGDSERVAGDQPSRADRAE